MTSKRPAHPQNESDARLIALAPELAALALQVEEQAEREEANESRAKAAGDHTGEVAHGYCARQLRMLLARLDLDVGQPS